MKKLTIKISFLVYSLWFMSLLSGCRNQPLYKDTRILMGTFVEVTSPEERALGIVFAEIKRLDDLLSKYKADSEVSRLNKLGELKVSPDTFYILKKSEEFWRLSQGAFDITVGPLVSLWGFSHKKYRVPQALEIKEALKVVGTDKIIFNNADNVVKFSVPGMSIDLGAIAKGYALDCAVKKLKEAGITSCLINAGGQIHALGGKPVRQWFGFPYSQSQKFGKPWRVAVKNPRGKDFIDYLELKDRAVATSGDYEQYFIKGAKRYSHILDPKTGYPANSGVISVTVIAADGLTADSLATSIVVMGKEKGLSLAGKFKEVKVEIVEDKDVQNN